MYLPHNNSTYQILVLHMSCLTILFVILLFLLSSPALLIEENILAAAVIVKLLTVIQSRIHDPNIKFKYLLALSLTTSSFYPL